jgi:cleavage stimulation factor subunit 2
MAQREKGGRVVFIGNIPYTVSEEEICRLFEQAGTVVNFRLVYDKETGKPKGFGFLEYTDPDSAATAVRNLNDTTLHGRTLRVDYSNDNGGGKGGQQDGSGRAPPPPHFHQDNTGQSNGDPAALPPLPPGAPLPPGTTAPDAISKTLSALPVPVLLDALSQMKTMATTNPEQAAALFASQPQFGYAIFQALLLLGLVDTNILSSLIQARPQQAAPPPQQAPPVQAPSYGQPPNMPPAQPPYGQPPMPYGSVQPPQPAYAQPPPQAYAPTPPVQQPAYRPPPQPAAPTVQPLPADPQVAAQIQQLLSLSKDQIYMIPDEAQRAQIFQLRGMYGGPAYL